MKLENQEEQRLDYQALAAEMVYQVCQEHQDCLVHHALHSPQTPSWMEGLGPQGSLDREGCQELWVQRGTKERQVIVLVMEELQELV